MDPNSVGQDLWVEEIWVHGRDTAATVCRTEHWGKEDAEEDAREPGKILPDILLHAYEETKQV